MKKKWKIIIPVAVIGIIGFLYYQYKERKNDYEYTNYSLCNKGTNLYQELMKNYDLAYSEHSLLNLSGYCSMLAGCIADNGYNKWLANDIFGINLYDDGEQEKIVFDCDKQAIAALKKYTQQERAKMKQTSQNTTTGGSIFNSNFSHTDGYFKCSREQEQKFPWLPDYKIDEFCGCSGDVYTKYDRIYRNKVTPENYQQIIDEIEAEVVKVCDYDSFVKWAEEHKF